MGYYTDFEIEIKGEVDMDEFHRELEQISNYGFNKSTRDQFLYSDDSYKWYDWGADVAEISKKYPQHLIIVEGEGEERGDHWRCYFRNGKAETISPEIVWKDSKLEKEFEADEAVDKMLTEKV